MKLNIFYDSEQKKCFLFEGDSFEGVTDFATIDLENHVTSNLHDFLQKKLMLSLLKSDKDLMELSTGDIKDLSFFSDDSFAKLLELINKIIGICNSTIEKCYKSLESVQETDDTSNS